MTDDEWRKAGAAWEQGRWENRTGRVMPFAIVAAGLGLCALACLVAYVVYLRF